MLLIFGTSEVLLNFYEADKKQCPNCDQTGVTFRVVQTYFHVFGLPTFPLQKYTGLNCSHCNYRNNNVASDMSIVLEKESRAPFYLYSGVTIFSLIVLAITLILIVY
jgi:hypothetical protein